MAPPTKSVTGLPATPVVGSTPATPSAGYVTPYAAADKHLHQIDENGVNRDLVKSPAERIFLAQNYR